MGVPKGEPVVKIRQKEGISCLPSETKEPDNRSLSGPVADADLVHMSKALGHPARLQIIRYLATQTSCVCGELVLQVELSQSTVSQHLKVLREAGLIQGEIDGPRVCYFLDRRNLNRFKELLALV